MYPLDDPRLTLAYAREHLDKLESAVRMRQVVNPNALSRHFDPDNRCYIFRYKLPEPPPLGVGLQLGDVVHNMRASLDHLVWRLARQQVEVPSTSVMFPVLKERDARTMKSRLEGVEATAKDEIDRLQPYQRGDRAEEDFLWLLNKLCVIAKHRHINTVGAYASFEIVQPAYTTSEIKRVNEREIMVTMPVRDEVEEDLKPSLSVEITLGINEPGYGRGVLILTDIHKFIRDDVFPRFERFFPQ